MYSVTQLLKFDVLRGAEVVAGHAGLEKVVTWVYNAGVPDAADWLNGGELVLTTAINLPESEAGQRDYVRAMADRGVSALAIATGRHIERIPDYLHGIANDRALPLIAIPYQSRFIDIVKTVNERIAARNIELAQQALQINKALTELVLQGGGMPALARKLAELVRHSISIETERFEAIATENIAAVDEARRYTQLHGRTDPRLVNALETRDVLPRIRATLRPVYIEPMPDVGLEMERILAPVVVHGEIYGYMWIIADEHDISELDMMAIEIGATIAALMILYQESVQSAEASLKGSLLSQLIQGDVHDETILTDQSLRYGVDLRAPYHMLLIDCEDDASAGLINIYRRVNALAGRHGWPVVVGQFAGQVVMLAQAIEDSRALASSLFAHLTSYRSPGRSNGCRLRIGVSAMHQGASQVSTAHHQCRDVMHISRRLGDTTGVVYFDDLGYLHALYLAGPQSLNSNTDVGKVRGLLEEKQADLFHTLEVYLDCGGNGVQTAETLHIHRSTLNYRLTRISRQCDVDLADPTARINLQVALKLMRLFEVDQTMKGFR